MVTRFYWFYLWYFLIHPFLRSHGSCLISSPFPCVPVVYWPKWSIQKKHSSTFSAFCKSSTAHQISYHSIPDPLTLKSNISISFQYNFCFLTPSSMCYCPAHFQIITYAQTYPATCWTNCILTSSLDVSFNHWPQLFHGGPATLIADAHYFNSLFTLSGSEGEVDIFLQLNFYFQTTTLPPCIRQSDEKKTK